MRIVPHREQNIGTYFIVINVFMFLYFFSRVIVMWFCLIVYQVMHVQRLMRHILRKNGQLFNVCVIINVKVFNTAG